MVSGIPVRRAVLSARARSRRMRPAMASLVMGGSIIWPSASRDTSRWVIRNEATAVKFSGTWSPRMTRARSARVAAAAAAWVARVWLASSKPGSRGPGVCSRRCVRCWPR